MSTKYQDLLLSPKVLGFFWRNLVLLLAFLGLGLMGGCKDGIGAEDIVDTI